MATTHLHYSMLYMHYFSLTMHTKFHVTFFYKDFHRENSTEINTTFLASQIIFQFIPYKYPYNSIAAKQGQELLTSIVILSLKLKEEIGPLELLFSIPTALTD